MAEATIKVCNFCQGIIAEEVDAIRNVTGELTIAGSSTTFPSLDFCCTEHMISWIQATPAVPTPNPLYPQVPVSSPPAPTPIVDPTPPAP